jgi:hypothetical protein
MPDRHQISPAIRGHFTRWLVVSALPLVLFAAWLLWGPHGHSLPAPAELLQAHAAQVPRFDLQLGVVLSCSALALLFVLISTLGASAEPAIRTDWLYGALRAAPSSTTPLEAARDGRYCAVEGVVRADGATLISPITRTPCVAWRARLDVLVPERGWQRLAARGAACTFSVANAEGQVEVAWAPPHEDILPSTGNRDQLAEAVEEASNQESGAPVYFDLDLLKSASQREAGTLAELAPLLDWLGSDTLKSRSDTDVRRLRLTEGVVMELDVVTVLGCFHEHLGPDGGIGRARTTRLYRRASHGTRRLLQVLPGGFDPLRRLARYQRLTLYVVGGLCAFYLVTGVVLAWIGSNMPV